MIIIITIIIIMIMIIIIIIIIILIIISLFTLSLSIYIKIHTNLYLLYMNHEVKNGFTPGPIESYRNARKISSYLLRVEL